MTLRQREGDQPLPVPNDRPGAHDQLIQLLTQRKQLGLDRYGSLLQPHNGRRTVRDLEEELLDGVVYARTLASEVDDLEALLGRMVDVWFGMTPGQDKVAELRATMAGAKALLEQRGVR